MQILVINAISFVSRAIYGVSEPIAFQSRGGQLFVLLFLGPINIRTIISLILGKATLVSEYTRPHLDANGMRDRDSVIEI